MITKTVNKKEELRKWIRWKKLSGDKYIKTSDICRWGVENYSNGAVRYSNSLAVEEGMLKRLPKAEAVMLGLSGNEGVWEIL